ncbi:MAG: pH regulation protein F, partial [Gemmatimonadetes bacterium]|nr:pH regulation protein F [Gemmatimonadota bacterium]
ALIYVFLNFIGTMAVLKFIEYGDLARSTEDAD